MIVIKTDS